VEKHRPNRVDHSRGRRKVLQFLLGSDSVRVKRRELVVSLPNSVVAVVVVAKSRKSCRLRG
jgi:hypothetical protein